MHTACKFTARLKVLVLMQDIVIGELGAMLTPKHADDFIFDADIFIEADDPLQCPDIGVLDSIAHRIEIDRLACFRYSHRVGGKRVGA